jgi:hypothetical protein
MVAQGFVKPAHADLLMIESDPEALVHRLQAPEQRA